MFPPFPDLPDDDPIRALILFRDYARDVVDYWRPYQLLAITILGPLLLFAISWLTAGFEWSLSWASDLVPLTFAVISVLVSVRRLREEHQTIVIVFVLVMGVLGSMVMHVSRERSENQHHTEMGELGQKVETVGNQNFQLLNAFITKPPATSQEAETERRQNIEKALRSEYILSHNHISVGLLAGTESPPSAWINKRLHELGEKWEVAESIQRPISLPDDKSRFEASFYPVSLSEWPIRRKLFSSANGNVPIALTFMVKDHMARKTVMWLRLCTGCAYAKEPIGFKNLTEPTAKQEDEANERMLQVGDFLPNVEYAPAIRVEVIPPTGQDHFDVGVQVGCENCDPINANGFQILRVQIQP